MKNTMIHPETGKILYRDVRPTEYTYKEQKIIVDQPAWYSADSDEDAILCREDMKVASKALAIMKERHAKYLAEQNQELGNIAFA